MVVAYILFWKAHLKFGVLIMQCMWVLGVWLCVMSHQPNEAIVPSPQHKSFICQQQQEERALLA